MSCRRYKRFRNDSLETNLIMNCKLWLIQQHSIPLFFLDNLNKHAPIKKRYITANESNFMTRQLSKAIMKRSKLRNRFLKEKSEVSRKGYW